MNPLHQGLIALAAIAIVAIAACGGTSVAPPSKATPAPTPIVAPSTSPVTVVQQQAVAVPAATVGATPEPVALPSAAGFAPTMLLPLPAQAIDLQLTVLVSNLAPPSAVPFDDARGAQGIRTAMALPAGAALLLFTELFMTETLALPTAPGFVIVIPADDVLPDANYYLALFDPARPGLGWQDAFAGPAAISHDTLTFGADPAPLTFTADVVYAIALYAIPHGGPQPTPAPAIAPIAVPAQTPPGSTGAATPVPVPSASASPAPGGSIAITITVPAAGAIGCAPAPLTVAVGATLSVACSEPGYAGPFHPALDDPALATIVVPTPPPAPAGSATPAQSPAPTPAPPSPAPSGSATGNPAPAPAVVRFTITGVASGSTTLRLQSDNGAVAAYSLTVTP